MSDTVYDLYTFTRNKWTLYQQYEGKSLNRAIGEAEKLLAANKGEAVGVIREGPERRGGPAVETLAYCDTKKEGVPDLHEFPITPLSQQEHKAQQGNYFENQESGDKKASKKTVEAEPEVYHGSVMALPVKLFTVAFIALGAGWGLWAAINHFGGSPTLMELLGSRNTAAKTMGLGFLVSLFILIPATITRRDIAAAFQSRPSGPAPARPPAPVPALPLDLQIPAKTFQSLKKREKMFGKKARKRRKRMNLERRRKNPGTRITRMRLLTRMSLLKMQRPASLMKHVPSWSSFLNAAWPTLWRPIQTSKAAGLMP